MFSKFWVNMVLSLSMYGPWGLLGMPIQLSQTLCQTICVIVKQFWLHFIHQLKMFLFLKYQHNKHI